MINPLQPAAPPSVESPDDRPLSYEAAGLGPRLLAALVDSLLIGALQVLAAVAGILLAWVVALNLPISEPDLTAWGLVLFGLLSISLPWGYYTYFEMAWNGESPGKRLAGLRVARMDGRPLTLTASMVRNLVRLIDLLPAYYGVGVLTMFTNPQARRLGDLAAGTLVVYKQAPPRPGSQAAPAQPALPAAPLGAASLVANWPLERLAAADVTMAEDFLRRRDQVVGREALARTLLEAFLRRLEVPAPSHAPFSAEELLAAIIEVSRRPSRF